MKPAGSIDIANLRALATDIPGEWHDTGADHAAYVEDADGNIIADCGDGRGLATAALIAQMKNTLLPLLDIAEHQQSANTEELQRMLSCVDGPRYEMMRAVYDAAEKWAGEVRRATIPGMTVPWLGEGPGSLADLFAAVDAAQKAPRP